MSITKEEVAIYLSEVFKSVQERRFQIAPRPKNQELYEDYLFGDQDAKQVILTLIPEDFSDAVQNDHKSHPDEILYIFGKDVILVPRYGGKEERVSLYIKINKLENQYVIIISFHKQEYPIRYKFK